MKRSNRLSCLDKYPSSFFNVLASQIVKKKKKRESSCDSNEVAKEEGDHDNVQLSLRMIIDWVEMKRAYVPFFMLFLRFHSRPAI